jgi:hypothetical protein
MNTKFREIKLNGREIDMERIIIIKWIINESGLDIFRSRVGTSVGRF